MLRIQKYFNFVILNSKTAVLCMPENQDFYSGLHLKNSFRRIILNAVLTITWYEHIILIQWGSE